MDWNRLFSDRAQSLAGSAVRELLKVTEQPGMISFAGGMPAPDVFPVEEVAAAAARVLRTAGPIALQYGPTEGYRPLRETIAARLSRNGYTVTADNVLITTGSQQALDLLGKVFLDPGDAVLVESPTYLAALQAWNAYSATYLTLPSDEDGIDVQDVATCPPQARLLYCVPNFQNPRGVTLPLDRREQLLPFAWRMGVAIVEDDPYGALRFEGEHLPRILDLDGRTGQIDRPYTGAVIYLSTFSKILSPGLRVGWIVAAPEVIRRLVLAKQGVDLHTPMLNQMLAHDLLASGFLDGYEAVIVAAYRERRDAMLAALDELMPNGVRWTHPQGGMFLWLTLPEGIDAASLLAEAVANDVAFVPGAPFHADGRGQNTMRLNFSNATPAMIREGVARLAAIVRRRLPSGLDRRSFPRVVA